MSAVKCDTCHINDTGMAETEDESERVETLDLWG